MNYPPTICRVILFCLLNLNYANTAKAESPPFWGKLTPGSYAVGFKTSWQLDYSRRYNMTFDDKTSYATGKAPRPILINMWYPAKATGDAKRMLHREYLDISPADPLLTHFSNKLVEYNRTVIAQEIMGKPAKELTDQQKKLLNQFLDSQTACVRNATPAGGKFPLIIYHSGHGSSFEDNSVLCEYLASHGYVVIGSAYQKPDGSSFGVDGLFTSARDFEFLIAQARDLPGVDWNHIGIIGHSGGAHAALTYRAQNNCAADAIVSLDTTQDYYSISAVGWREMTNIVMKNAKNMTGPVLMVANPHAFFQLADSWPQARRYYLTIKNLSHNDFSSQGCLARAVRSQLPAGKEAEGDDEEKLKPEVVKAAYESLCVYVLHFLDAELKGDAAGKVYLAKQFRNSKLGDSQPHVEYVPEGQTSPESYQENSATPPTPRQLRHVLRELGSEKTIAMLKRFRKEAPTSPIYHHVFGLALVIELLELGNTHDAIAFRDYYREVGIDCDKVLMDFSRMFLKNGNKSSAADYLKKVLLLDPANQEATKKLKELGELK